MSVHLHGVHATDNVSEARDCDLIVFAVKNYDVPASIPGIAGAEG